MSVSLTNGGGVSFNHYSKYNAASFFDHVSSFIDATRNRAMWMNRITPEDPVKFDKRWSKETGTLRIQLGRQSGHTTLCQALVGRYLDAVVLTPSTEMRESFREIYRSQRAATVNEYFSWKKEEEYSIVIVDGASLLSASQLEKLNDSGICVLVLLG